MGGYRPPILFLIGLSMACIANSWRQDRGTELVVLGTVAALGVFSITDLETRTIPNKLVLPFVGLAWMWVSGLAVISGNGTRWIQAVGITVLYAVVFLVLWFLGHLGAGDVKIVLGVLLVAGWLGPISAMIWIVISWVPTVIHGLVIKPKQRLSRGIPQAPYFTVGFVITVLLSQYLEQL